MNNSDYETRKKEEIEALVKSFTYYMDNNTLNFTFQRMVTAFVKTHKVSLQHLTYEEVTHLAQFMRTTLCVNAEFMAGYPSVCLCFRKNRLDGALPDVVLFFNIDRVKNEVIYNAEITLSVPLSMI